MANNEWTTTRVISLKEQIAAVRTQSTPLTVLLISDADFSDRDVKERQLGVVLLPVLVYADKRSLFLV